MTMTRKKLLINVTVVMLSLGFVLVMTPFIISLKPNLKAEALLPRIDLSDLVPGKYVIQKHPAYGNSYNGYQWGVLMYFKNDGTFKIWDVPIGNGGVGMPDMHWYRPMFSCKDFGPSLTNGLIDESMPLKCHDDDIYEWWKPHLVWDIDGKNIKGEVDNLKPTRGHIEGNNFVFGKNS